MAKAPIFKTGRVSVSNSVSAYKKYKETNSVRSKMSIRERIASWIYPAAFEQESWDDIAVRESDTPRGDPTLSFKIYNTNDGNKIVEFYSYDHKTDRSSSDLYVITSDEDYGQALARIAMLKKLSS
jgi:hypothetical protein